MDYTEYKFNLKSQRDFYYGLVSDVHADSSSFAKHEFIHDIESMIDRDARLFINGDLFDAILPTDKKRYQRSGDFVNEDAQVNARIKYVFDLLKPYVNYIDFIGIGNHEASIVKYSGSDLIAFLVLQLNAIRDSTLPPIQRGSYQGFMRLRFSDGNKHLPVTYTIYREHGKGGAAAVTKGTINIQRLHTTFIADLYWLGHTHTNIVDKTPWTVYADDLGKIIFKQKRSVITAGYQGSFEQRNLSLDTDYYRNSFPEEKFLLPGGQGSALLHLLVTSNHDHDIRIDAEITS
jgi:hypothetical protein